MPLISLFLVSAVTTLTTALTTVVGFAVKLTLIALLTLFIDLKIAIAVAALYSAITFELRVWVFRDHLDFALAKPLLLYMLPGLGLGLFLFSGIDVDGIKLFFSVFLLLFVLYKLFKPKQQEKPLGKRTLIILIFLFGLFESLLGAAGPILGIVLIQYGLTKERYIALISLLLLASATIRSVGYGATGFLRLEDWPLITSLTLAALLGTWIGKKLMHRVSVVWFERAVLITLTVVGVRGLL